MCLKNVIISYDKIKYIGFKILAILEMFFSNFPSIHDKIIMWPLIGDKV